MTSCPSRASSAAATDESTPPLIATTMRMTVTPSSAADQRAKLVDRGRQFGEERVHLLVSVACPETESNGVLRTMRRESHRAQHVRRLQGPGGAGRSRRYGESLEIQSDQQRLGFDAVEADVGGVRDAGLGRAVD